MKNNTKYKLIWFGSAALLFVVLYLLVQAGVVNLFVQTTIALICSNIMLAAGLNLIIGFSGQFSLGHAGFMAIGAYSTAIISSANPTVPGFIFGLIVGMFLSGLIALLVGIPTLRLKGDYLAIATLGVSEIIRIAIINMEGLTNGSAGIFGIVDYASWEVLFVCTLVSLMIICNYINSSSGRATLSIREDEIASESMGVNTTFYKTAAFVIGAVIASVAGGLQASFIQTITPKDYGFLKSVDILIIAVFGGLGSITGTVVAAIVLGILNMFLQNMGDLRMIVYSLALILIMIFKPSGLLGTKELSVKRICERFSKNKKRGDV